MLLWWGHDPLQLRNDAGLAILRDQHPAALGAPAAQIRAEAWGIAEESHFTFSLSLPPHEGLIGGVLITVQETSAKVRSERQIRMLDELAHCLPPVLAIENEIRLALTHLVFNAVDAMSEGGTLMLRTTELPMDRTADVSPRHYAASVSSSPIPASQWMKRRAASVSSPPSPPRGERGTGLGLPIVYGAAQGHGADIEIDSAPGRAM